MLSCYSTCTHGLFLVQSSPLFLFFFPSMEHLHTFEGVSYIPPFMRDKDQKWASAGWLSKQMVHFRVGQCPRGTPPPLSS